MAMGKKKRRQQEDLWVATLSAALPTVFAEVTVVVLAALLTATVEAQGNDPEEPCSYDPTPVEVAVTAVPIEVVSTTAEYFVLYVKHDVDGAEVELPVLVKLGQAGTTTLVENVAALPKERYRVMTNEAPRTPMSAPPEPDAARLSTLTTRVLAYHLARAGTRQQPKGYDAPPAVPCR